VFNIRVVKSLWHEAACPEAEKSDKSCVEVECVGVTERCIYSGADERAQGQSEAQSCIKIALVKFIFGRELSSYERWDGYTDQTVCHSLNQPAHC